MPVLGASCPTASVLETFLGEFKVGIEKTEGLLEMMNDTVKKDKLRTKVAGLESELVDNPALAIATSVREKEQGELADM